jgi:hypothetical protein
MEFAALSDPTLGLVGIGVRVVVGAVFGADRQPAGQGARGRQRQARLGEHQHRGRLGRAILAAPAEGTSDPAALAELARGRLRRKHDTLVEALAGSVGPHQRFLLTTQPHHLTDLDALIDPLRI